MSYSLGFVVVEYNQASQLPGLPFDSILYSTKRFAQDELDDLAKQAKRHGRGETYKLAQVVLLDDED